MKQFKGYQRGINLGGWFSQCVHTAKHYDSFITEPDFQRIAGWGLDHVRLPIDYDLIETEDGQFCEAGYQRLQKVVDLCGRYQLNLILDLHKTAGFSFDAGEKEAGFFDSAAMQERFYRLWEEMARRFGKYADRVSFELLNEVTDKDFAEKWNEIADTCIRRIRAIAPSVNILVGGYWNNAIVALPDLRMPQDEHIIYNFHFYEPLMFTHQGAHWIEGMSVDFRVDYPGNGQEYLRLHEEMKLPVLNIFEASGTSDADAKIFDNLFAKAASLAEERGVALYCGEYGVIELASDETTLQWYKDIHSAFEKYGIGRAAWTYRRLNFGITDEGRAAIADRLIELL